MLAKIKAFFMENIDGQESQWVLKQCTELTFIHITTNPGATP